MDYRNLQNNKISLLGMGCMRLPVENGVIDQKQVEAMVALAIKNGVNYFDTAYYYHNGASEQAIGRALKKYPRESFFLADKLPSWDLTDVSMAEKRFNEQLMRCGVEYFDFYLAHNLNSRLYPPYHKYKVLDFLEEMKAAGKIRHLGFSFHDKPALLEEICKDYAWDFAQLQINYLDWELQDAKTQYAILEKYHLPCIVMEPIRGGSLAALCPEAKELLKSASPDKSIASWALRWAAQKELVFTVLSGMSNQEQMQDNLKTLSPLQKLTQAEEDLIAQALTIFKKKLSIPCTQCCYCEVCPVDIDIPEVLRIYNQFRMTGNKFEIIDGYERLEKDKKPENCLACGLCTSHCPQGLNIPELMQKFAIIANQISMELKK